MRLKYINTVSNLSQYEPRPTISAMETLRLEAERRKFEAMVAKQKSMADKRRAMRKIADGERYLKGWKKSQWQKYWTPEDEDGRDAWVADRASIDAFEAQHGAAHSCTPSAPQRTCEEQR